MCTPRSRSAPRRGRILWRHILPNIMPPIIVLFTTRVGTVILAESEPVVPRPRRAAADADLGRHAVGLRPHLHVPGTMAGARAGPVSHRRRLRHQRVRRRACAICSIRACAARDSKITTRGGKPCPLLASRIAHWPQRPPPIALVVRNPRRWAQSEQAAIWRHARGRHRLRDAVGAVVRSRRLELEAQPRHRRCLRAAVRRRSLQVEEATAASIRSMPTPGCPSDAIRGELAESWEWKENPLRVEIKLRKGVMFPEKPGVMAVARTDRRRRGVQPTTASTRARRRSGRLFRPSRQGRSHRPAHGGLHLQRLQRRMGLPLRLGLLLADLCRRKSPTPAPATGRTSTAPARSCSADFVQGNSNTYVEEPELLGQGEDRRRRVQAALRRQGRLSHHQGRGDLPDRAAHRQARHPREHPLVGGRRAEKERAAAAMVEMAQHERHVPCDARRHQAVRRHPRPPRAQSRGQQAGNRQGILRRQCRAVRLSAASRLSRLFRAAGGDAGFDQGALHLQSREGEEAAGRSRRAEGLHLQGAGLLLLARPHGPAAAGRRLSGAGRRQDRDPADGVRRVPLRHDHARPTRPAIS